MTTAEKHRGVDVEGIRRVVNWLDSEQAPDAVVSHHGVGTNVGDFHVRITPGPPSGRSHGTVLVFDVPDRIRQYVGEGANRELANGIAPDDREALQAIVKQVVPVLDAWNGVSTRCSTCSFHLDKAPGEGVRQARANYIPFENTRKPVTGITPPVDREDQHGSQ